MADTRMSPQEYLKKPYSRVVIPDAETGTYTAQILEFPGCIAEGKTVQQAYKRLEEAAASWIEAAQDLHQEIPFPTAENQYGGKVALRLPKSLHRQAAMAAEQDKTSLNQFIVMAVAEKVGASESLNGFFERMQNWVLGTTPDQLTKGFVEMPDSSYMGNKAFDPARMIVVPLRATTIGTNAPSEISSKKSYAVVSQISANFAEVN